MKVIAVQRLLSADRQAHAVKRQRIVLADRGQVTMRRTARDHVILGMNFEEADVRTGVEDGARTLRVDRTNHWAMNNRCRLRINTYRVCDRRFSVEQHYYEGM